MKLHCFGNAVPLFCVSALPFTGARRTARLQQDLCCRLIPALSVVFRRKGQHYGPGLTKALQACYRTLPDPFGPRDLHAAGLHYS